MRPSPLRSAARSLPPFAPAATRFLLLFAVLFAALSHPLAAQTPRDSTARQPGTADTTHADTTHKAVVALPRPPADSDTTRRAGALVLPGTDLPVQVNLRIESKTERDLKLRCNSTDASQISSVSGCNAGFLPPALDFLGSFKAAGTIGDRMHVNVDYDMQREFDASQTVSLYYEGKQGSAWQRVDVGNIDFVPPSSRFMTSSLPSGNYGLQITNQIGAMRLKSIFARQTGNVVQNRRFTIGGGSAQQVGNREVADYQIERLRFFFTIDPALLGGGRAYPNIDILNSAQLQALRSALPDTLRPTRVLVYRLQYGTQPQNPNGPRFQLRDDPRGQQTYDLLREGVDYYMDPSLLWFALVRPLNETNERLVVAYNVRLNGSKRDTVWVSTGGTPDLQLVTSRPQVANLIMDPNVGPSSPEFRNEVRSVYRIAGEDLVRESTKIRVVTGSGLLEHPMAGNAATFLQMFGLAQSTNPAEFDYENRIWPRRSDPVFNLGAGAADIRNVGAPGTSSPLDAAHIIRDYFLVFPSLRPFSARDSGLVVPGNPTNDQIYSIPGEYLYSPQHPASVYRFQFQYHTSGTDEAGAITLGATQMRRGSERVTVDGRTMVRDLDYRIDYDLGRIEFTRPDTLFAQERKVEIGYEENPVFAASPTTLAGFVGQLPVSHGTLNFVALDQSQSTPFTQPQLGFQGNSTLTAGMTGQFDWSASALTNLVSHLPFGATKAPSHVTVQGEFATSHPQFLARNGGTAYVETFEQANGTTIGLGDIGWYYSSLPAYGHSLLSAQFGPGLFDSTHAATLTWQSNVQTPGGQRILFHLSDIDPLARFVGSGIQLNEPVLWLTLLPLDQQGRYDRAKHGYDWTNGPFANPPGRRFRSIRTVLSPSGLDLSNGELLQFWTLIDTSVTMRAKNPALIFDFGDVSENSLVFGPDTLTITHRPDGGIDSVFTGRKLQGFDSLNTERDPFSHSFNVDVNDTGLPGDWVDTLVVIDGASVRRETHVRICRNPVGAVTTVGDPQADCTVGNNKLDEEDIDQDNAMNFFNSQRESENILRYVIDLSDPSKYTRVGGRYTDTVYVQGQPTVRTRNWVLVSTSFNSPTDSLNNVNRRRLRALRLTVVSGAPQGDEEPTQFPLAVLRVTGAPWVNRSNQTRTGVAGIGPTAGAVISSTIGTNDSSTTVVYQSPPGIVDQAATKGAQFQGTLTQVNESSMRIQTVGLPLYNRAEVYYRFPTGPQFFLGYQQLRVWGRGRGSGWGTGGDLQMYLKVGRDENNFYMYRTSVNAGSTAAAWSDIPIDFSRFTALRKQIETAYLSGKTQSIACTGADSAIIAASPLPVGSVVHRFAACDDGYMMYTTNPAVTAPNLAAVQEVAVGIIRVNASGGGTGAALPGDTLELWVDDIRLDQQVNTTGMAGQVSFGFNAADFFDMRMSVSNRDPNFRQLGDQPTFVGQRSIDLASTVRLEKLLPASVGLSMPLTITKTSLDDNPLYLSQTDVLGNGIPGLRKPENDVTTYSLSIRRTTPISGGVLGPLLNNLSATSSYATNTDRTDYQDGGSHTFTAGLDYLVTGDSARTLHLPSWLSGTLGALPDMLQAGPLGTLRSSAFRWNPTQIRFTTGIVRGDDRTTSYLTPSADAVVSSAPALSTASSRLWRNGSIIEFRPTGGMDVRWEIQSERDLRNYGDTTDFGLATPPQQRMFGVNTGFERERTMLSSLSFAPAFSAWFRPRAQLSTDYEMLRDPNMPSYTPLPGVIGVDSLLAVHDSSLNAHPSALPRRMTSAQTASIGTGIDLAHASRLYSADSSLARRIGSLFAPIDVSYTRSLLSSLDASPVAAPVAYQLAIGGPAAFRTVNGVDATLAGQTGMFNASGSLILPFGTSLVNRYSRTTTLNWIARPAPDSTQAEANGQQTQFPDVSLRWAYRPNAVFGSVISNVNASVGYIRSEVSVALPDLIGDTPPEIRHTEVQTFPMGGTIVWGGSVGGGLSTGARYSLTHRIDSLPGSLARTRGDEVTVDAGRAFRVPSSWGLGLRSDIRTRIGIQQIHNSTYIYDELGTYQSRLQDNGRQAFNLTADTNLSENMVFTFQGSHIVTYDNNLSRRFAQTVFSTVLQVQFFGAGK